MVASPWHVERPIAWPKLSLGRKTKNARVIGVSWHCSVAAAVSSGLLSRESEAPIVPEKSSCSVWLPTSQDTN